MVAEAVPGAALGERRAQAARAAAMAAAATAPMTIPTIVPGGSPVPAGHSVALNTLEQLANDTLNGSTVQISSVQLLLSLQFRGVSDTHAGLEFTIWHTAGKQPFDGQLKPTQEHPGMSGLYTCWQDGTLVPFGNNTSTHESVVQGLLSVQFTGNGLHEHKLSKQAHARGVHTLVGGGHVGHGLVVVDGNVVAGRVVRGTTVVTGTVGTVGTVTVVVGGTVVEVRVETVEEVDSSHLTC